MKKFRLLILLIFFISCNVGNNKSKVIEVKSTYKFNLIPSKKVLDFQIGDRVINRSPCIIPYSAPDSSQFLYYQSGNSNSICVFSLDSLSQVKTIQLQQEGPDGVGNILGFEVINSDSIYITSAFRKNLYLVNNNGKVVSYINYSKYNQQYDIEAGVCNTFENLRIGFKNSKIYMPFYPGYDEGNYKFVAPEDIRIVAEIDTLNKTVNTLNIGFPKDYWKKNFFPEFFGFFIYENIFYINYMYDDRILTSIDGKIWKAYNVPSRYINVKNAVRAEKGTGSRYSRLVPDPFRNVFYRFVVHEQIRKDRTLKDLTIYSPKFSIMILDHYLNIIGETLFPIDTYDPHGYFITKDGIFLSLSNPFNPNYKIDKLEFQLFNLSDNEK